MKISFAKYLLLIGFVAFITLSFTANDIGGTWYNTEKDAKISIYESNGKYFGKLVWLKEPKDENGNEKVDKHNPDASKRNNKVMNMLLLKNFTYDGEGVYSGGTIYDPKNGKEYKCKMTLKTRDQLDVRGYIGIPALGRTENWTRAK